MTLTDTDILARKAALESALADRQSLVEVAQTEKRATYTYVCSLSAAADAALEAIENLESRFMLGLDPIDFRTRGMGAKEMILLTGFAHQGKTQLINTAIKNNRDKRVLFFSMDDPAEMILLKLVCMEREVDAETLERQIRSGDSAAKMSLRRAATDTYSNLIVVDQSLSIGSMDKAIEEATDAWGAPPQAVVIDYLASVQGEHADEDGGVRSKAAAVKRWVKNSDWPTIVAHQNSRSGGGPGKPITLTSGGYGGEAEATMVLGVRRKRDDHDLDEWVRDSHLNTITLHLVKNKRPPGKLTSPDGIDFEMVPETGLIRVQRENLSSAAAAISARKDMA